MPEAQVHLAVQPVHDVGRDLRRSLPWLVSLLALSGIYVLASAALIRTVENGWGFLHACYFTIINMTTVGFGDVLPATHIGKLIAGANAFAGLLFFGILVAVVALSLQPSSWSGTMAVDKTGAETFEQGLAQLLASLGQLIRGQLIRGVDIPAENEARRGRIVLHVHRLGAQHFDIEILV